MTQILSRIGSDLFLFLFLTLSLLFYLISTIGITSDTENFNSKGNTYTQPQNLPELCPAKADSVSHTQISKFPTLFQNFSCNCWSSTLWEEKWNDSCVYAPNTTTTCNFTQSTENVTLFNKKQTK
jgi:hypothetical protein